jgi:prepilin-type processing-associated H-X9-DG protein
MTPRPSAARRGPAVGAVVEVEEGAAVLRGAKWLDGHYGNTLYNHYYPPNPPDRWDCGNTSHNKGLSTARSYHTGGVNLLLADGSVRFIRDGVELATWRGLSTRAGGEVLGDF